MIPARFAARALTVAFLAGCGGEETAGAGATGAPADCAPPNRLAGGACRAPGVQDDGCPAGTLGRSDGTCQPAGVPPEMCGDGFVHDGDVGCASLLPVDPCPKGFMAVPGDTECQPVMPCAPGTWGDIPVDATTEHVDGAYAGSDSDGSAAKPWSTIGAGVGAAAPGAIVAVAAGSYPEDVVIVGKPVVLWGVCPDEVEIVGAAEPAAVFIREPEAGGTVLRGVAITGLAAGILLAGSEDVLVDRVWVHDSEDRGINVQATFGPTSATVRSSLVEQSRQIGVFASGSEVTIEATEVRGTQLDGGHGGRGINIQESPENGAPAKAIVRGSLVGQNHDAGVFVRGSEATIEATVVRGTLADVRGLFGRGIAIQDDPESGAPSTVVVRTSLIEQNRQLGMFVSGSKATIEATVIRGTLPDEGGLSGRGIGIQNDPETGAPSIVSMSASVVDQNHDAGVFVRGSEATIEATVVRGTLANGLGLRGRGISIELGLGNGAPSIATVRGSRVEDSREFGVIVVSATATLEGCLVRAALPDGAAHFGDGISAFTQAGPATLSVGATRIEDSARAGVSGFGASVSLGGTGVQCAAFDLDGEPVDGAPSTFDNRGGNACGCPTAAGACVLVAAGIEPPTPLPPGQ